VCTRVLVLVCAGVRMLENGVYTLMLPLNRHSFANILTIQ